MPKVSEVSRLCSLLIRARALRAAITALPCLLSSAIFAAQPQWDGNWVVAFGGTNHGTGMAAFGADSTANGQTNNLNANTARAKAEAIADANPWGSDGAGYSLSFERKFVLPAGNLYCVEVSTSLSGNMNVISGAKEATVTAAAYMGPAQAPSVLDLDQNANKAYSGKAPRDGLNVTSPGGGWTASRGTGYILPPGNYSVRGILSVSALVTNGSIGVDAASRFFNTGFEVSVSVTTASFTPQPAFERGAVCCWPDAAAPANTFARRGIIFDFELAAALNTALAPGFNNLMCQFNECYSGGMIDDLFDAVTYPNLAAGQVSAAAAARHDQPSWSNGKCKGGMGWGTPYAWAVKNVPYATGKAAWYAEKEDPFGPRGTAQEVPQYKSSGQSANEFVIGTRANRRAIVFVGNHFSVNALGNQYVRDDYYMDIVRIRDSLQSDGYAAGNIQILAGPGWAAGAAPCAAPAATAATRANFFTAITNLPTAAAGTKEYYLWTGDHGMHWFFFFGPFVGVVIQPLSQEAPDGPPDDGGGGIAGASTFHGDIVLDATFISLQEERSLVYLQSETPVGVPIRITINGVEIFNSVLPFADQVLDFDSNLLVVGNNAIEVENLSPTTALTLSSLAIGSDATAPDDSTDPADLNADGVVNAADFQRCAAAFGQSRNDAGGFVNEQYDPLVDFDGDLKITFADYQIWLGLVREANP